MKKSMLVEQSAVETIKSNYVIRGREQHLIDYYGGIGSPMVGNSRRGVGYYNFAGRKFYDASSFIFGEIAPYTGFF